MVAFAMALLACEPIEDRLELKNSFDPEKIELKVVQPSTGSNKLSIQMNTPGVVGFWDYGIDRGFTDRVEPNDGEDQTAVQQLWRMPNSGKEPNSALLAGRVRTE